MNRCGRHGILILGVVLLSFAPAMDAAAYPGGSPFFQNGDRVLFVGDEMTQQMFYTRAVAAAVLPLYPDMDLRFFNGGREGATAAECLEWTDELLGMVRPSVVFICFGLNEAQAPADPGEMIASFASSLGNLIDRAGKQASVRQVVVIGPPPIQSGLSPQPSRGSANHHLLMMSSLASSVAATRNALYIDLYEHLAAVYLGQIQVGGDPLTIGGLLPTEMAHTIIASLVLRGVGLSGSDLERIGWSPLLPAKMRAIRQVLATPGTAAEASQGQASRELYIALGEFDTLFFRMWRLPTRRRGQGSAEEAFSESGGAAEQAWQQVQRMVRSYPRAGR